MAPPDTIDEAWVTEDEGEGEPTGSSQLFKVKEGGSLAVRRKRQLDLERKSKKRAEVSVVTAAKKMKAKCVLKPVDYLIVFREQWNGSIKFAGTGELMDKFNAGESLTGGVKPTGKLMTAAHDLQCCLVDMPTPELHVGRDTEIVSYATGMRQRMSETQQEELESLTLYESELQLGVVPLNLDNVGSNTRSKNKGKKGTNTRRDVSTAHNSDSDHLTHNGPVAKKCCLKTRKEDRTVEKSSEEANWTVISGDTEVQIQWNLAKGDYVAIKKDGDIIPAMVSTAGRYPVVEFLVLGPTSGEWVHRVSPNTSTVDQEEISRN